MCTAISYTTDCHYFGRNLDWEHSFGEKITITPRNYQFSFKKMPPINRHYAIIGVAITMQNYPLYFESVNEHGLGIAGLNFPDNAFYNSFAEGKVNIAPYEFIPWVLCNCKTTAEALDIIKKINILNQPFSENLPLTPLHWIISDKHSAITVEPSKSGLKIYNNPVGVLTNNPPFEMQMMNLNNYINLSPKEPENRFSDKIKLLPYSRGMGALGLPGDLSSQSRFVRACYTKSNCIPPSSEKESVSTFFHILSSTEQQKGCVMTKDGKYEYTIYSSCCNTDNGIFYCKPYYSNSLIEVNLYNHDLESKKIIEISIK